MQKKRKLRINKGFSFVLPYSILYLCFGIFPLLYTFYISLNDWNGISEMKFIGLENYKNLLFQDYYFWRTILNTVTLSIIIIPISMAMGLLLANLLHSKLLRGKRVFQVLNFTPYITTPVAIGVIFALMFNTTIGVVNKTLMELGIITENIAWLDNPITSKIVVIIMGIWKSVGYQMIFFLAGLASVPHEMYEAATIDGAGAVAKFFRITIPSIKNIIKFLVLINLIAGFQLLQEPMLLFTGWASGGGMIGGPQRSVFTVIWYMYDSAFGTSLKLGKGAAIAYLVFAIILVLIIVVRRIQKKESKK